MGKVIKLTRKGKGELELEEEINLCLNKIRGLKTFLENMERILKNADTKNHNEITLNAIRGTNVLLSETMATWGQDASEVNEVLYRLLNPGILRRL